MIKKKISKNFTTKIRKESFLFKTIKQFHIKKILIIDKLSKVYPHPPFFLLPFSSSREKSKRINRRQEGTNSKKNFLDLSARDIVFQNSSQLLAMCACVCVCARISKVHANHGLPLSFQDFSKLSFGREMSLFKAAS